MRRLLLTLPLLVVVAGCGGGGDDGATTVLAASSLTEAFEAIADAYDGRVTLSFGASSALRTQLRQGAEADVLAVADDREDTPFATNRVVILVAEGNPEGVRTVADLAGRRLALCAPEVPCGVYADEAFAAAGVERPGASQEENARGVVQKVAAGEADAGIGYLTDAGTGLEAIPIDGIVATLTIDGLTEAGDDLVSFVLSEEGQAILARAGFGPPPGS